MRFAYCTLRRAGGFMVFYFSHIGSVATDQKAITDNIQTIEGNANGKGDRDSVAGDGVWKKERAPQLTKSYLRLFADWEAVERCLPPLKPSFPRKRESRAQPLAS